VKQHPIEGVRLLRKMGYDNEAMLAIVRSSHESWTAPGIPMVCGRIDHARARIVAVADTYDALTSWRPYREPWPATPPSTRSGGRRHRPLRPRSRCALVKS